MARPAKEAACPSALPPLLARWAAARAHPTVAHGVDASAGEVAVTPGALAEMLAAAASAAFDPHLGLRLYDELPFERYDALAMAVRAAPTVGDVIDAVARLAPLLFPRLLGQARREGGEVAFSARIDGYPRGLGLHVDELVLGFVFARCRRAGDDLRAKRVWLASARPPDMAPIARFFGTSDVTFGREDAGFAIAREGAARAIASADPLLRATADAMAERELAAQPRRGALRETIAARVEAMLGEGCAVSMDDVAGALRMSARTLSRRLDEEGTRFSDVVDGARERTARRLVRDPSVPLTEAAFRAGFTDLATFTRAFKRWTGVPPGAFRRA